MDQVVQQTPAGDVSARRGLSLRWQLAVLCLGLLVPTLLFVGVLLWQFASSERGRVEAEARSFSIGVAVALDREINGVLSTLQALSTSPSLQTGDLAAFYAQASEIHRLQKVHVSLRTVEGRTLLTTRAPFGASVTVPRLLAETDREVVRTGAATISNLFTSATSGKPVFQIVSAPVKVSGAPTYLLAASVDLEYLVETIRRENLPGGWIGALTDRNGIVAVRTVDQDAFSGKSASADFRARAVGEMGSYYGQGADGSDLLVGYARSGLTGWTATAAVASSVVSAPLQRSLYLLLGLGLVLGSIAIATALFVGRRLDRAMQRLGRAAREIGRGRQIAPLATAIPEVNQVGFALATAARQLVDRGRERDEAEAALRESNDQLQRYAYIVSHDLRAPLVNIMGFTSELESTRVDLRDAFAGKPEGEAFDRDIGEALGFIRAAVTKMEGLIAAILKLSREGRRVLRPERLGMSPFLTGLADAIRHQTESVGATIEVAPDLPAIDADRLAVEQVFGNLLDNAVKYLSRDRPGRIVVTGEERGSDVVYRVADNGRGIAAQDRERVFELFRRAGVQDRPGEGIGLAHVRTVVRAMGGQIDLASEFGRGTTFSVTLPRRPVVTPLADPSVAK